MSEYQYVAFRAIDSPVSAKNLQYMHRQSSRAKITPWSFENEYHYGDFRGDAEEMLRRGYDVHLHYANFGIRRLLIRLPRGLPDPRALKPYLMRDSLRYLKDKQGPGGILAVDPFLEPGYLEDLWDLDDSFERLLSLRAELLEGDLRPLYLAHLAVACDCDEDDQVREGPVPAGLQMLTDAQYALVQFYGLSDEMVAAAADKSLPLPPHADPTKDRSSWLRRQSEATKNAWLESLLADPSSSVRAEILAKYARHRDTPTWPTTPANRAITELRAAAEELAHAAKEKAKAKAARQRAERHRAMAADPEKTLRETERLAEERTVAAYTKIGQLLADLSEALEESGRSNLVIKHAQKLKAANPGRHKLSSELRRRGFLPK